MSTTQDQTPPTNPPPPPIPAAARPACAACKHSRRRCWPGCPLAPYFPNDKQTEFNNVHRLFGISHVVKLLNKLPPDLHDDAVASIIYEANSRAADPVGGACAFVLELYRRIERCNAELKIVSENLAYYRTRSIPMHAEFQRLLSPPTDAADLQESRNRSPNSRNG